MNAYSSIQRDYRRSLSGRLHSRAYRRGIREGFGATALLGEPREYRLTNDVDVSVAQTWNAVGDALRAALQAGEVRVVKATRETESAD